MNFKNYEKFILGTLNNKRILTPPLQNPFPIQWLFAGSSYLIIKILDIIKIRDVIIHPLSGA